MENQLTGNLTAQQAKEMADKVIADKPKVILQGVLQLVKSWAEEGHFRTKVHIGEETTKEQWDYLKEKLTELGYSFSMNEENQLTIKW